jgi:transglutaminase-like putative cysteine protease
MLKNHKQARLTTEELHEVKWLIGGLLSLLSLWSLFSLEFQSAGVLALGFLMVGVSLFIPQWIVRIPRMVWRLAGPLIALLAVADFVVSMPQFLSPLMRMVVYLLIYRTLASRRRREDLQLMLLCLFSVVVSGVLTVSLLFALQILLFSPIAMGLLFVLCLLDTGPEHAAFQPSWQNFRLVKLIGRVWQVIDFRVLSVGTVLFAFVVCISTMLFVLIPRFNLEQALPFLQLGSEARSGFNGEVRLGDVTEIREDNSVALRVDVPSLEAIDVSPYWRMLVLDKYSDGYFRQSKELQSRSYREYREERELPGWGVPKGQRQAEMWTFYLEGGISEYLPMPGAYQTVRFASFQHVVAMSELYVLGLNEVRQSVFFYQIEDLKWTRRFPASRREVEAFSMPTDSVVPLTYPLTALELDLSAADRAFVGQLNEQLTGGEARLSAARYSQIVTDHLRKNFRYSLLANGGGSGDPVVDWLRLGDRGHCELFAGSFVLLARAAGYPARMAVGFMGGSWNPVEAYFVVRNSDAHAWVEIYDRENREWLRVDPTPGASPSNPDLPVRGSFEFESGLGAWVDSLRILWYRRIVNFDQKDQLELALVMDDLWDEISKALSLRLHDALEAVQVWVARPFSRGNFARVGMVLGLGVFGFFLWRSRYWCLAVLFRLLKRPKSIDPVRRRASRYLRRLKQQADRIDPGAQAAVSGEAVRGALEALRFGPAVSAWSAKPVFVEARRALRRRWK